MDFNEVLNNTGKSQVISEQHDVNQIDWVRGMSDPGEMISCGYLPQLRRNSGEQDREYAARIRPLIDKLPLEEKNKILKIGRNAAIKRANLHISKGKVSMVSARVTPWHALGTVLSDNFNTEQALEEGNLSDWDLQKLPVYSDLPGIGLDGKPITKKVLIPDIFSIVRGDTGDALGHVGPRYEVFSNENCFAFMDEVIKGGAKWETAGALGKGEVVWMLAKFPQFDILGDQIDDYIACGTSHDGSSAVWVYPTKVRLECQNTLRMSKGDRKKGIYFKHTKNMREKAEQARQALGLATKDTEEFKDIATHLATHQIQKPLQYFNLVLDDVLDETIAGVKVKSTNKQEVLSAILKVTDIDQRKKFDKQVDKSFTRRRELLLDIIGRFESERCNKGKFSGTAWAAYNALTENADHSIKWKHNKTYEDRFHSVLDGAGQEMKEIALEKVLELTK